jgi:urease accessory protein
VRADLGVIDRDARLVRNGRPFVLTNCFTREGLEEVLERIDAVIVRPIEHSSSGAA